MYEDVETAISEVRPELVGHSLHGIAAQVGVTLVRPDLIRHVVIGVVQRIQGIHPLQLDAAAPGKITVQPVALQQPVEDAPDRGPCTHTYAGSGRGQRPHDGPTVAGIVRDSGDEGALPCEIDRQHGQVDVRGGSGAGERTNYADPPFNA